MIALVSAVFIASLLGSTHCAGMCGAFVAFAVADSEGPGAGQPASRWSLNAAYNFGRLVTYVMLGVIAGALGAAMDLGGSLVGVQRGATMVAGTMMIAFGLISLLRIAGVHIARMPVPGRLRALVAAGHRFAFEFPPRTRAWLVGALTVLLPCGWLYAFVITAAGTASPALGALTMAVFWAGTLPMLVSVGVGVQALAGVVGPRLPLATSLLVVIVGVWTALGRMTMPALATPPMPAGSSAQTTSQSVKHVQSLDAQEMPCCADH